MRVCTFTGTIDENCLKCKYVLHLLLVARDDLESISAWPGGHDMVAAYSSK
jgi:hypothetical protein